jgi:hypothetical protein
VTNPIESLHTYPVVTAYTESLAALAGIITSLLANETIVDAYSGCFEHCRNNILFDPEAADDDRPAENEDGWDAIVQGETEAGILANLERVFANDGAST